MPRRLQRCVNPANRSRDSCPPPCHRRSKGPSQHEELPRRCSLTSLLRSISLSLVVLSAASQALADHGRSCHRLADQWRVECKKAKELGQKPPLPPQQQRKLEAKKAKKEGGPSVPDGKVRPTRALTRAICYLSACPARALLPACHFSLLLSRCVPRGRRPRRRPPSNPIPARTRGTSPRPPMPRRPRSLQGRRLVPSVM